MQTKRASLFAPRPVPAEEPAPIAAAPAPVPAPVQFKKAKTREGKRVVTAYLAPEALKQLQRLALDEDSTLQDLMVEAVNDLFAKRGLTRLA